MMEGPERYRSPDAWPYAMEIVDVDKLLIDNSYQRAPTKIADEIAKDFDRTMLDPLLVSKRPNGRYAVIDGQNRMVGAKRIGERYLYCRVLVGLSIPDEARLFVDLQEKRKSLTPIEKYKASVTAGNALAVAVQRFLKAEHVEVSPQAGFTGHPDATGAIDRILKLFDRLGQDHMHWVFQTIKASFPDERGRWQSEIIGAVSKFYEKTPDAGQARTMVALSEEIGSVKELLTRSAGLRRGSGMGGGSIGYTVQVIERAYRKVGRGPFRSQWEAADALAEAQRLLGDG